MMRRLSAILLCGLCLLAMNAMVPAALLIRAESKETASDRDETQSIGQTTVTAQVLQEDPSPDDGNSDQPPEDTKSTGTTPEDGKFSNVHTGVAGTWITMMFLFLSSCIMIVARKIRRLSLESKEQSSLK